MHLPCHREHFKSQSGVMKSEETSTGQASSCRSLDAFSKKPCPSMVNWTQFHLKRRVFYRIYPWTLRTCGSDVSKWQWLNQPQKKWLVPKKYNSKGDPLLESSWSGSTCRPRWLRSCQWSLDLSFASHSHLATRSWDWCPWCVSG